MDIWLPCPEETIKKNEDILYLEAWSVLLDTNERDYRESTLWDIQESIVLQRQGRHIL